MGIHVVLLPVCSDKESLNMPQRSHMDKGFVYMAQSDFFKGKVFSLEKKISDEKILRLQK